jgi:hypothetical protein
MHYPIVMQQGNSIYSFFLNIHTYRQTDTHSLLFIRKKISTSSCIHYIVLDKKYYNYERQSNLERKHMWSILRHYPRSEWSNS